jgi:hypothetical protein
VFVNLPASTAARTASLIQTAVRRPAIRMPRTRRGRFSATLTSAEVQGAPDQVRRCRLGSEGLVVGALGLGCMGMIGLYGPSDERESIATIHRALELGVDMLDTSDA